MWQFTQEPPGVSVSVTNLVLSWPESLAFEIAPSCGIEQDGTQSCNLFGGWGLSRCLLSIDVDWSLVFAFALLHPLELLQPTLIRELLKFF